MTSILKWTTYTGQYEYPPTDGDTTAIKHWNTLGKKIRVNATTAQLKSKV